MTLWTLLLACSGPDAEQLFARDVVPALERSCSTTNCHGVAPDAEARGEVIDWGQLVYRLDAEGHIADVEGTRIAALRAVNTREPGFSTLLRKPLAPAWGGQGHFGGENWGDPEHPDYLAVLGWIEAEARGGEDPEPLTETERIYAEGAQPVLQALMCFNANCHGPDASVPYRLDPGVRGRFSTEILRENHRASVRMLALDGSPLQSRLIRKALPLHDGGIVHKGGNTGFLSGTDDARLQPLLDWVCAERKAALGTGCSPEPLSGLVFVRGPVEPEHPFDADGWVPGTDLWLASLDPAGGVTSEVNLTGSLHAEPADVRDPAVDPTGHWVLFAMRTSADTGHDVWELELATGAARPLTTDAGPLPGGGMRTYRDPTWAPDGSVWLVSTRAGVLADAGTMLDTELYQLLPDSGALVRRSWTPHVERKPVFYTIGGVGGEVAFSSLRDAIPDQARAHTFRFPPGLASEYHQHFGITPVQDLVWDMRELADGRYVAVLGELARPWGGELAVVDRNFGPEINDLSAVQQPSLPFYADPMVVLDDSDGWSWRDPVGLPDGRILAARAADPETEADFGIAVVAIEEAPDGSGPRIAGVVSLVDGPGVADTDPEPVIPRASAPLDDPEWDPGATTATFIHQGYDTVDALLGNLSPSGIKAPTPGVVAVRFIEAVRATPAQRHPVDPSETRHGIHGATTAGLSAHGVQRILGEVALAPDGSFQVELPAGIAVRLQGLDADGMAVGTMHNRWYDFAPGQVIKQGVQGGHYPQLCGACHGALDGDPDHAFVPPDVITHASLTLSRYDQQNPRLPLAPVQLGDASRTTRDFRRDVQPILDRRCGTCHGAQAPEGGVALTSTRTTWYSDAYETLLAPGTDSSGGGAWVDASSGRARGSYLVELLTGTELEAPGILATVGVRHAPELTDEELGVLVEWIELGAPWVGDLEVQP